MVAEVARCTFGLAHPSDVVESVLGIVDMKATPSSSAARFVDFHLADRPLGNAVGARAGCASRSRLPARSCIGRLDTVVPSRVRQQDLFR
jgi:hypothetical protein